MTHSKPSAPDLQYRYAFLRLEQTAACWRALTDLIIPELDLHIVDRADFAELIRSLSCDDAASSREDSHSGRLEELRSCCHAVADLLRPNTSLGAVDKDQLATLCFRLAREQAEALRALDAAIQGRAQS